VFGRKKKSWWRWLRKAGRATGQAPELETYLTFFPKKGKTRERSEKEGKGREVRIKLAKRENISGRFREKEEGAGAIPCASCQARRKS